MDDNEEEDYSDSSDDDFEEAQEALYIPLGKGPKIKKARKYGL